MSVAGVIRGFTQSGQRRKVASFMFSRIGPILCLLIVVVPVAWVLIDIVARAVPHWRWDVIWTTTEGAGGGLANAIVGTIVLLVGVFIIAGSVGVLGGVYLAELAGARKSGKPRGQFMRSATEVLAGVPSIVLGYVGYIALVVGLHWGYSLLPALLVLSVMVMPYIARGTETALRQVPTNYREGAEALGMSTGQVLRWIVVKAALPGIVTALLIALAISGGETAPLLYTAGWSTELPKAQLLHSQVGYLTYPVWTFWNYPSTKAHYLAWDAALLLLVLVLVLLVAARIIVRRTQRHAESRAF